jgi:hypothetical protein
LGEIWNVSIISSSIGVLIWKKKAYDDLYAYFGLWFLVVVNQPSDWSQIPLKSIPDYNVTGKWH